jgi:hypothetical protein
METQAGKHRVIEYNSYVRGETLEYDSTTNEIVVGSMAAITSEFQKQMKDYPARLDSLLACMEKGLGVRSTIVTRSEEDRLERFDVTFTEMAKDYGAASITPRRLTVWIDPQTRLIQRLCTVRNDSTEELSYQYGEPVIRDIYDLGVPRSAKIVDNRPSQTLQTLLDRFDSRYKKGFGDYAAVLVYVNQDSNGQYDRRAGNLTLFGQNGSAWFVMRYVFVTPDLEKKKFERLPKIIIPPEWESMKVEEWLKRAKEVGPWGFLIHDGQRTWSGMFDRQTNRYFFTAGEVKGISLQLLSLSKAKESLPGMLWLNKSNLDMYGPTAKAELVSDASHPKKIGIRSSTTIQRAAISQREEKIYWIDPSRDDLPVETIVCDYQPDGKAVETEYRTCYRDYAKLPNGQWYPTRWESIARGKNARTREYRLYLDTHFILNRSWFANPVGRFSK